MIRSFLAFDVSRGISRATLSCAAVVFFFATTLATAQEPANLPLMARIDPPSWWVGMQNSSLELCVYGKNIANATITVGPYAGVSLVKRETTDNPNYVFLTLSVSPKTKPGNLIITARSGNETSMRGYALQARTPGLKERQGFSAADAIYMIMPDRFANGDPSNDVVPGFPDQTHRDSLHFRHGGDIEGIIGKLDYIRDLGMTAVWCTPLIENNMPRYSYHGYAFTDFYAIDRRFGTNEDYRRYVDSCHAKGLKVIQDVVLNHMGDQNYLAKDPPSLRWINDAALLASKDRRKDIVKPNYRASTHSDPYASEYDKRGMTERWFDWMMPDLNVKEPHLARYLIQNTIWWIEFAGLDGLRVDTYPYPAREFTVEWIKAVLKEYPKLGIVGEVWISESVAMSAYWQAGALNRDGFNSYLPALTDFPLNAALSAALNEKEDWSNGLIKIYNTLAQDFIYADAGKNLIFLDNHDLSRFFSIVGEDVKKLKMALAMIMTMRGAPQVYYGTEIAMAGYKDPDPLVRKDFPGGWREDSVNAFTAEGRSPLQNEVFNYLRALAQWRKSKPVIHSGKTMQFVPSDGVYVYFRYNDRDTVMVVANNNDAERVVPTERFAERLGKATTAKNVVTGETLNSISTITIPAKSALVLELM
jgi:glycosidase